MTKFVLMWEEEPMAILANRADAEEMWLAFWEENLFYEVNFSINVDASVEYVLNKWDTYKRLANYGYWIDEVPYFN